MYFPPAPFWFAKCDGLTISLQVGKYRKAANVPYPNAYCSHDEASKDFKKKQFNCAQRAHVCLSPYSSAIIPLLILMNCPSTTSWRHIQSSWRFWQWVAFVIQSLARWEGSSGWRAEWPMRWATRLVIRR